MKFGRVVLHYDINQQGRVCFSVYSARQSALKLAEKKTNQNIKCHLFRASVGVTVGFVFGLSGKYPSADEYSLKIVGLHTLPKTWGKFSHTDGYPLKTYGATIRPRANTLSKTWAGSRP